MLVFSMITIRGVRVQRRFPNYRAEIGSAIFVADGVHPDVITANLA
jgi:hypothetical protein